MPLGYKGIPADECKELTVQEGEFKYFGWNPFIGEEAVWHGEDFPSKA
jgi:hypothetical protein